MRYPLHRWFFVLALGTLPNCRGDFSGDLPRGYSKTSHSNTAAPDYERLFDTEHVHRLDLVVAPEVLESMRSDLNVALYTGAKPLTEAVTVVYDDREWEHVGMRFKGLKSAKNALEDGREKFSFKLTFDAYEDEFDETKNQRFYGFKKLNFSANPNDNSQLHEVLASEVMRQGGVPTARAAFWQVFVDSGRGATYWGLYTMVEDPDDSPLQESQLKERGGNLYQAVAPLADWKSFDPAAFQKENHKEADDFSDVASAIATLNSNETGPQWRSALESLFAVDVFLDWLALNTVMVNGDAYGCKADNYYLYGVPSEGGRLHYIPTDFNAAFVGNMASCGSKKSTARKDTPEDLFYPTLGMEMPLISRLLADETYRKRYREHLAGARQVLDAEAVLHRARELHELVAPYVTGDHGESERYTSVSSPSAFENSVEEALKPHIRARNELVDAALDEAK